MKMPVSVADGGGSVVEAACAIELQAKLSAVVIDIEMNSLQYNS